MSFRVCYNSVPCRDQTAHQSFGALVNNCTPHAMQTLLKGLSVVLTANLPSPSFIMALDDQRPSQDQVAFISTASLINSLHAAGYIPRASNPSRPPSSSEHGTSRRSFLPQALKILDAFAELLDINQDRMAVACRHTSLDGDTLRFELIVCGAFPQRSKLEQHSKQVPSLK